MSKSTSLTSLTSLRPFIVVSVIWLLAGLSWCLYSYSWSEAKWLIGLWFACVLDLIALAIVVEKILTLVSDFGASDRLMRKIQIGTWGILKLACFGLVGLVLYKARVLPVVCSFLGVSTLVVVPILGGLWRALRVDHA